MVWWKKFLFVGLYWMRHAVDRVSTTLSYYHTHHQSRASRGLGLLAHRERYLCQVSNHMVSPELSMDIGTRVCETFQGGSLFDPIKCTPSVSKPSDLKRHHDHRPVPRYHLRRRSNPWCCWWGNWRKSRGKQLQRVLRGEASSFNRTNLCISRSSCRKSIRHARALELMKSELKWF